MSRGGRGWNMSSRRKPAIEYDIRVERGLFEQESAGWPAYGMVTTPSAYEVVKGRLVREPEEVVFVEWLDSGHQQALSDRMPGGIELVVGLGGGKALDASKFVALDRDAALILAPTILSSGAIIHGNVAKWDGYRTVGSPDDWPWVDCEYVLVDVAAVLKAPDYLHTAGLGDILCGWAGVEEWRRRSALGQGPTVDEERVARVEAWHEEIGRTFAETLDGAGAMTEASAANVMARIQERDHMLSLGAGGASGDHPFWIGLEVANQRTWIHGELVALGAMLITWCCQGDTTGLAERLDRCRVRWRPGQMGLEREALKKGLAFAPEYMEGQGFKSVLKDEPVTGGRFDAAWKFMEG